MTIHDNAVQASATVKDSLTAADAAPTPAPQAFTFGDPVPVLDGREILDYLESANMGKWYEPPVSFDALARSFRAAVHHSSPLYFKRNVLASTFRAHPALSRASSTGTGSPNVKACAAGVGAASAVVKESLTAADACAALSWMVML